MPPDPRAEAPQVVPGGPPSRPSKGRGRRRRSSPELFAGLVVIGLLALVALLAPWIAPHDPVVPYDTAAGRHLPPGSLRWAVERADGTIRLAEQVERLPGEVRFLRLGRWHSLPEDQVLNATPEGVADRLRFPLGTDRFGRDLASRLLHGARVSLRVALAALVLATSVGLLVGSAAALLGGWVDALLMRGVDALLAFPKLFLVVVVSALWDGGELVVVVVLGGTAWMEVARLIRGELLRLREQEVILAGRAVGVSPLRLLLRYLYPLALPPVLVYGALLIGDLILVEAALSFLGWGVESPKPSWGNIIGDGQDALLSAWWVSAFPGLAIALTVMGFALLADGLRDRMDPKVHRA
jgi:peptide/nickel transport system permease protein